MTMIGYENRRENLWKDAYARDPVFPHGEAPVAKVINFFCKNTTGTPVCLCEKTSSDKVEYGITLEVDYVKRRLDYTIRYTKKWNDYRIYILGSLQEYIKQCIVGGYSKCILSRAEYAILSPKKRRKNAIY